MESLISPRVLEEPWIPVGIVYQGVPALFVTGSDTAAMMKMVAY